MKVNITFTIRYTIIDAFDIVYNGDKLLNLQSVNYLIDTINDSWENAHIDNLTYIIEQSLICDNENTKNIIERI